jgi:hypothetical protein
MTEEMKILVMLIWLLHLVYVCWNNIPYNLLIPLICANRMCQLTWESYADGKKKEKQEWWYTWWGCLEPPIKYCI